jgi:hypothetical protein
MVMVFYLKNMEKNVKLENLTNSELELLRKQKRDQFEEVRVKIINLYDYWMKVEQDYKDINEILNNRNKSKLIDG